MLLNRNNNQFVRFNFNLRRVVAERSIAEQPVTGDIVALTFLVNCSFKLCSVLLQGHPAGGEHSVHHPVWTGGGAQY